MSEWVVLYFYQGRREPGGRRERLVVREAVITGGPDDVRPHQVAEQLQASTHASRFTTHGDYLANRRIMHAEKTPKGVRDAAELVTIEWAQLTGNSKPKQLNVRASAAEHARWLAAANRAGRNLQTWVREALNLAATQV